jgi:hypothetical protein
MTTTTPVKIHRIGEVDQARRIALRTIHTARLWAAEGDRRAAAVALHIAAYHRRLLAAAKLAHADCCPDAEIHPTRPARLPRTWQTTAIPGEIRTGRWLP